MKKHNINYIADWARDHGIKGFDHLDPKVREKHRFEALKKKHEKEKKNERFRSSAG
tara:strand:+ start:458 stop:625 length:168 start_codon:yes stop_codon:yes gene_type:complete